MTKKTPRTLQIETVKLVKGGSMEVILDIPAVQKLIDRVAELERENKQLKEKLMTVRNFWEDGNQQPTHLVPKEKGEG